MARRWPLLLLLLLPAFALGALFLLDRTPSAPEGVAGLAVPKPLAETVKGPLGVALDAAAAPPIEASAATNRRVGVAARIEGRIAYTDGAVPGGPVLVVAGAPRAHWQWERAARRLHAGLDAEALLHGFADADGHFALEWTGEQTELYVAALAPTAATKTALRWRAAVGAPLTLTLEPRAALFVEVKAGAGFNAATAPSFLDAEIRLRRPSPDPNASDSLTSADQDDDRPTRPGAHRNFSSWVDQQGTAAFLAVVPDCELEVVYKGPAAVEAVQSVPSLRSGERRSISLELDAGAHILGRVVDPTGAPIPKARIRAHRADTRGNLETEVASAVGDDDGRFELERVDRRAAFLVPSKVGFLDGRHALVPSLVDGVRQDVGDIVLDLGVQIAGHVRHPDGSPAVGAKVYAEVNLKSNRLEFEATRWTFDTLETSTDARGYFELSGLKVGFPHDVVARSQSAGHRAVAREMDLTGNHLSLELVLETAPVVIGRVLAPDGTPKARARVRAVPEPNSAKFWEQMATPQTDFTDAQGNFRIQLEKRHAVSLEAHAKGFGPSLPLLVESPGDQNLDLRLRPAVTVVGRVIDAAGQPVGGADVGTANAFDKRMQLLGLMEPPVVRTDANGQFSIGDQPPGELVLVAQHPQYAPSAEVVVEWVDGAAPPVPVLTLRHGASVLGVLYQEGKRAGPGLTVGASGPSPADWQTSLTDKNGEFRFDRLPPGRWTFAFTSGVGAGGDAAQADFATMRSNYHSESIELVDGETYQIELGAAPEAPVAVRGVVRRAGESLTGGRLVFTPHAGRPGDRRAVNLDQTGHYEVLLPGPGSYTVTVSAGGYGSLGNNIELRREIPNATSHQLDIQVPGGAIRGRVLGPDGRPMPWVMVEWTREDGIGVGTVSGGMRGNAQTNDQGQYQLDLLSPGTYRVAAGGEHFAGMIEGLAQTARSVRVGVVLKQDEVREGVDFELAIPGEVRGRVRDSQGKPVALAALLAWDATGAPMESWHTIQSDALGNFDWPGFAPGDYTFYARGGGLASAESAPITVRAGEVSEVELVLRAGAFLMLSVDGVEPGQMAEGMVRVDVRDAQNRQVGALFGLGAEAFGSKLNSANHIDERSFGPLPPGSYRAIVTGPDGHRAERVVDLVTGQKLHLRMGWED